MTHAFCNLPEPEFRGVGTFEAPPLDDSERAVIQARAAELESSADPVLHQAGIDNCRLLAEIDSLSLSKVANPLSDIPDAELTAKYKEIRANREKLTTLFLAIKDEMSSRACAAEKLKGAIPQEQDRADRRRMLVTGAGEPDMDGLEGSER